MNLNRINVGIEFKNYRELCECLEISIGTGKQKELQMKEMNRFFEWNRDGNKFIIIKLHDQPLPKPITNKNVRKKTRNILLESLLLNFLSYSNNGEIIVNKNYLFRVLKMINDNYDFGKRAPHLLANYLDVAIENVNEFYEKVQDVLTRQLENTLKQLYSKSLIDYATTRMVCVASTELNYNDDGEVNLNIYEELDEYGIKKIKVYADEPVINKNYREATEEENNYIRKVEHEELKKMDVIDKQDLVRYGKWETWNKAVNERIRKEKNITYYYTGYKIRANPEHVEMELIRLGKQQEEELGIKLNNYIQTKILDNTIKRHKRSLNNDSINKNKIRKSDQYIHEHSKIMTTVVDINEPNKRKDMKIKYNNKNFK